MTRTHLLNQLITTFDYQNYLEIGVFKGWNFNSIICQKKVGVDPDSRFADDRIVEMTSDDFFKRHLNPESDIIVNSEPCPEKFDLVFIDGMHTAEQVARDFENALNVLAENGTIILHDCNPPTKAHQQVPRGEQVDWNGDVWKTWVHIVNCCYDVPSASAYCLEADWGLGVFSGNPRLHHPIPERNTDLVPNYSEMATKREHYLNLISVPEWNMIIEKDLVQV